MDELFFVMDDSYELEHRDDPEPIVSDELSARMEELAEEVLFGGSASQNVA